MIEIEEALRLVAEECATLESVTVNLEQASGHVLAEDLTSDVDSPPFDKSMMDGFAVRAADVDSPPVKLEIVARVLAGASFEGEVDQGKAAQIMTGAPIPAGADSVVMVEQTEEADQQVTINADVRKGQNVLPKAAAMRNGQSVMDAGTFIRGEDVGLLAEAGNAECTAIRRPSLAVIATGDELIDAALKPAGSQIRNSNGPMLAALAGPYCQEVINLGIGPDDPKLLSGKIQKGLNSDVLVLSGGVSAGVADLVPGLLQEAGVQQIFHKVRIKPGKPIWFGLKRHDNGRRTLVFGLPGNPVSSMVCFRVFVAPALLRLAGRDSQDESYRGRLATDHSHRPGRTTYWPSRCERTDDGLAVTPLNWKGSSDLRTLAEANCFAVFDGDSESFAAGHAVQVYMMR